MASVSKVTEEPKENRSRGILFAVAAPVVGIILWVILWRMGVIASLVSFAIAFLTIWLYKKGSGGTLGRKNIPIVMVIAILGVVLAFFAGMISDGTSFYEVESGLSEWELLRNSQFWDLMGQNFRSSDFWSSYTGDILWSLGFAILGMFGTLKDLFAAPTAESESKEK